MEEPILEHRVIVEHYDNGKSKLIYENISGLQMVESVLVLIREAYEWGCEYAGRRVDPEQFVNAIAKDFKKYVEDVPDGKNCQD